MRTQITNGMVHHIYTGEIKVLKCRINLVGPQLVQVFRSQVRDNFSTD